MSPFFLRKVVNILKKIHIISKGMGTQTTQILPRMNAEFFPSSSALLTFHFFSLRYNQ